MQRKMISLLLLCMALFCALTGCGKTPQAVDTPEDVPVETTEATIPPTTPADGDPDDVTCQGTYTVGDSDVAAASKTIVATIGSEELTNGQLQVYYWLEVAAYRQADNDVEPDFSAPLDTQVCPLDSSVGSWQQYFLAKALNAWHARQALVLMAQNEALPTEEAYNPDPEKQAEYMTGQPATQYLYGWNEIYEPNRLHQAYLDILPETLVVMAVENGFGSDDAQAKAIAGAGADAADLLHCADLANRAYMYFTEMGYHFEPTAEDVEAFYNANAGDYPAGGEKTVDFRHILLIPENAGIAEDGTVTADESAWEACRLQADSIRDKWAGAVKRTRYADQTPVDPAESRFSEYANQYSADSGSSINGGLYVDIHPGQLIPELDAWCFDENRRHGDVEILRSACGYHIVFFSGATEDWYAAAEAELTAGQYRDLVADAMETYPVHVDYSAICLGQAQDNGSFVTTSDLLYPDIAHERFPDVPLYLQQDYPDAYYGAYKLSSHGCGITTMAMLASYMADDELTPPELASRYGYYCGRQGTETILFNDLPAELGFHFQKRSDNWEEIDNALRNGQIVINLQWAGYWTRGGHYIAITGLTDDGRYVVRDSNLFNYKRLSAHLEDSHSRSSITGAGQGYWIYEKKVTRIPACVRCGEEGAQGVPEILFRSDYHCAKCLTAMERRNNFLNGITG